MPEEARPGRGSLRGIYFRRISVGISRPWNLEQREGVALEQGRVGGLPCSLKQEHIGIMGGLLKRSGQCECLMWKDVFYKCLVALDM